MQAHEAEREKAEQQKREACRAGNAERQRRHRERNAHNAVTERDVALCGVTERDASPQVSPKDNIKPLSSPTPKSSLRSDFPARNAAGEILEILGECLEQQTAADLVAHRKAKKSALTPGSARALVKSFVAFGNPEAAAQAMLAQGWTGFKPEWMQGNSQRAGPPSRPNGRETLTQIAMGNFYDEPQSSEPISPQFATDPAKPRDGYLDLDLPQQGHSGSGGRILDFSRSGSGWR
ncbi:MAG: hypothetical protein P4M15_07335 [Alphaproteobacteria bacterium]|nr:hypothetical protein [Alphaproteobacteria bacterium]